ncbi:MAG: hypothetical protein HY429_02740 [Candidatus Levybacteria bacterium]|nr:hypothetical protein [Candidatus Levybacteria bacterium]
MEIQHSKQHCIAVANDVVRLVLSGLTKYSWTSLAGGIVGTGTNLSFFLDEHYVVNLESGNFNKFMQSDEGKSIDSHSVVPGNQLF